MYLRLVHGEAIGYKILFRFSNQAILLIDRSLDEGWGQVNYHNISYGSSMHQPEVRHNYAIFLLLPSVLGNPPKLKNSRINATAKSLLLCCLSKFTLLDEFKKYVTVYRSLWDHSCLSRRHTGLLTTSIAKS